MFSQLAAISFLGVSLRSIHVTNILWVLAGLKVFVTSMCEGWFGLKNMFGSFSFLEYVVDIALLFSGIHFYYWEAYVNLIFFLF